MLTFELLMAESPSSCHLTTFIYAGKSVDVKHAMEIIRNRHWGKGASQRHCLAGLLFRQPEAQAGACSGHLSAEISRIFDNVAANHWSQRDSRLVVPV